MNKVAGYGRYQDDPTHVGCPRAKSDMTPCIARNGHIALADDKTCVGCGCDPKLELENVKKDVSLSPISKSMGPNHYADQLQKIVRRVTDPERGQVVPTTVSPLP